jgi:hypothetical protein
MKEAQVSSGDASAWWFKDASRVLTRQKANVTRAKPHSSSQRCSTRGGVERVEIGVSMQR